MLRLKQDTPTQTGQQPLKYKHHLQMNVVLQSGGDASVSFKSLPLPRPTSFFVESVPLLPRRRPVRLVSAPGRGTEIHGFPGSTHASSLFFFFFFFWFPHWD